MVSGEYCTMSTLGFNMTAPVPPATTIPKPSPTPQVPTPPSSTPATSSPVPTAQPVSTPSSPTPTPAAPTPQTPTTPSYLSKPVGAGLVAAAATGLNATIDAANKAAATATKPATAP